MTAIGDSSAIFDSERMLAQHQAALTILQGMLSNPALTEIHWLDLACGRGQIIAHLDKNLNATARAKLHFVGYDIEHRYVQHTEKLAMTMGLAEYDFGIGELADFVQNPKTDREWDLITLTNTVHEINPRSLASLLLAALNGLRETGCLFVYDMDRLTRPELGAVLWTASEFTEILTTLCRSLGSVTYEPPVGTWKHRTCDGWNTQLNVAHMQLPRNWQANTGPAIQSTVECITQLLRRKLASVSAALEALTRFGSETQEEAAEKESLLFDYWAINRALGCPR